MELVILRSIERLLALGFGGLAIYLGYRLFLHLPERTDSSGKVILPGGVNIMLSRIGPGAFFALFGSVVVALSFYYSVSISLDDGSIGQTAAAGGGQAEVRYVGMGSAGGAVDPGELARRRARALGDITVLNGLPGLLPADLAPEREVDLRQALRRTKLALMSAVWSEDWGDASAFRRWVEDRAAADPVPEGLEAAARVFRRGAP